jgi:hypothetical protein
VAVLASQEQTLSGQTFCRACGKPIEADARYCRFCGKPQTDREAAAASASGAPRTGRIDPRQANARRDGLEQRLRELFPRHHLQDEFMHIGTITAFFMGLIGFVLGFFPAYTWLAQNFLLGAIALVLFLILRESTLSHIRAAGGRDAGAKTAAPRYQAGRTSPSSPDLPPEAATTQSSPPGASAAPRPPRT